MVREDAQALLNSFIPMELRMCDTFFVPSIRWPCQPTTYVEGGSSRPHSVFMDYLVQTVGMVPPTGPVKAGKVGRKVEAAGKTRLFMILDSISQRLLQPLHEWVFSILRLIPQDGTFAQTSPIGKLQALGCKALYSFDLRSATDRMPSEACEFILERIWGPDVAVLWRTLLYREFHISRGMEVKPEVIFTTGTPLGSLSSWGIFTLFHHLLVQHAAYAIGGKRAWFSKYAILGDDLVIGHRKVAKMYKRLLKLYGVDISKEKDKSLQSIDGSLEFASRYICRGYPQFLSS